MQLEVGAILEGKVTGITKFGAFVSLPDGKSGLVHISEIANTYVNDVREHVSEGATVKVRVIGFGEGGKINLSIKKAEDRPPQAEQPRQQRSFAPRTAPRGYIATGGAARGSAASTVEPSFEDKLKQFMQDSDNRISGNRLYSERKNSSRRKRG